MAEAPVDGIYDGWSSASVLGGRLEVAGEAAGPAGVSVVQLDDGSFWEVDHAEPAVLVAIEVDASDPAGAALAIAAFGADAAMQLAEEAVPLDDASADNPLDDDVSVGRVISGRRPTVGALAAGRLVLLADLASDAALHPLARIAAVAELIPSALPTAGGDLLAPMFPSLIQQAEDLSGQVDDDEIVELEPGVAQGLSAAIRRAIAILGGRLVPNMTRLAGFLESVEPLVAEQLAAPSAAPDFEAAGAFAAEAQPAALREETFMEVEAVPPWGLRIRVARSGEQRWVRVLRRDGLVLVAQAPLMRDGLLDLAEVVIPPDTADDEIEIQVLGRQELAAPAPRRIDLITAAVAAGRDAARADRLGRPDDGWLRCASLWALADDPLRADKALELSRSGRPVGLFGPSLLADRVTELVGAGR